MMSKMLNQQLISQNGNVIKLREGLFYNQAQDSYIIETKNIENLGIISIGLQITKKCNASCIHCAASQLSPDLPTESLIKLIRKIHKEGCVRICFTGGEPLLRPDLVELLKFSKEIGITNTLSTNGFLLTRDKIREIKPYINNIRFSLHGLEKSNDHIFQRKGAFKTILKKISLSVEEGLSTGIIFSAMRSNISEMYELAQLMQSIGLRKMIVFTLMSAGRAESIFAEEFVHVSELDKEINKIKAIKQKEGWQMDITLVDWRLEGQCILIDPMGIIYGYDLSQGDHYRKLGNAFEEDIRELWKKYPHKQNYFKYYQQH